MKKSILFILFSSLCFGQMSKQDDAIAEALMKRDLTKQEQKTIRDYSNKLYVNKDVFMADLQKVVKAGLFIPTEYEANCAGRLIASASKDGYKLTNRTYDQVWDAARNFCREYVDPQNQAAEVVERIDMTTPEKEVVLQKSAKEDYQYIEVKFTKTKTGFSFNNEQSQELKDRIKEDFASDKLGNYTAFYDVFSVNDKPEKIKLKARLNR